MSIARIALAAVAVVVMSGCAHPITINPDITKITRNGDVQPIDKSVGYYISQDNRQKEVTTPGGGGDKVTYTPYKDIESAFYAMLTNVFKSVSMLNTPAEANAAGGRKLDYVIDLDLSTNSYSPSPFTWPPTQFTVNMGCKVSKPQNAPFLTVAVVGEGKAEFSEFKRDFSLSARRASQDALLKMQNKLLEMPELRK